MPAARIERVPGNLQAGEGHDLWTQDRFGDFILDLEYRTNGNSGVFIRKSQTADESGEGVKVQIDKPMPGPSKLSTGALCYIAAPSREASRADN